MSFVKSLCDFFAKKDSSKSFAIGFILAKRRSGTLGGFFLISCSMVLLALLLLAYFSPNSKIKASIVVLLLGVFVYFSFSFPTSLVVLSKDEKVIVKNVNLPFLGTEFPITEREDKILGFYLLK